MTSFRISGYICRRLIFRGSSSALTAEGACGPSRCGTVTAGRSERLCTPCSTARASDEVWEALQGGAAAFMDIHRL